MSANYLLVEMAPDLKESREYILKGFQYILKNYQVAIIYPTFDKKCYIGLLSGSIAELRTFLRDNLVSSSRISGKLVESDQFCQDKLVIIDFFKSLIPIYFIK